MKTHYQTLGLKEGASQDEVKEAYERLSKELDPVANDNEDFFVEEFIKVREAYKALSDSAILATEAGVKFTQNPSVKASKKNRAIDHNNPKKLKKSTLSRKKLIAVVSIIILIPSCIILLFFLPNHYLSKSYEALNNDKKDFTLALESVDKLSGFYSYFYPDDVGIQKNRILYQYAHDTDSIELRIYLLSQAVKIEAISEDLKLWQKMELYKETLILMEEFINHFYWDLPEKNDPDYQESFGYPQYQLYGDSLKYVSNLSLSKDMRSQIRAEIALRKFNEFKSDSIIEIAGLFNTYELLSTGRIQYLEPVLATKNIRLYEKILNAYSPLLFWDSDLEDDDLRLKIANKAYALGSRNPKVLKQQYEQYGVYADWISRLLGINALKKDYELTVELIEDRNYEYNFNRISTFVSWSDISHFYNHYLFCLLALEKYNEVLKVSNRFLSIKDWDKFARQNKDETPLWDPGFRFREIYVFRVQARWGKEDWNGAISEYDKALEISGITDIYGLKEDQGLSTKSSDLLRGRFAVKWNSGKINGDKKGACEDLRIAADLNPDKYYDEFLKVCN
jgi:hypothetical protein